MAGKKKPEQPVYVALAGGHGLREDGVWEPLPDGYVPPAPSES
jgi:hypothetical protein